ncbi:MAG: RibD family protein [Akkermansiaceae bacterium]
MALRIIANFAITADGKISTAANTPARFTSKADLHRLRQIRQTADAILVGRGTLEADQMTLTSTQSPPPWRCIISRSGVFNPAHKLFSSKGGPIHLIVSGDNPPQIENTTVHQADLSEWLDWLSGQPEVETLLCEGGGMLMKELFKLDRIDELYLTLAGHTLFGGKNSPTLTGVPGEFLPESRHFELKSFTEGAADEYFLHYCRKNNSSS